MKKNCSSISFFLFLQQKVSTAFNFNLLWKSFEKCSRKERYCLSECLLCIYCCSFLRCRTFFDSNWTCLLLKYFLCYASQGYCAYFACLAGFSLHTTQIRCEHSWMNVSQQWILMYTRSSWYFASLSTTAILLCACHSSVERAHEKKRGKEKPFNLFLFSSFATLSFLCLHTSSKFDCLSFFFVSVSRN